MSGSIQNILSSRWLNLALRLVLGVLFVFAGVEKISQPEEFAKAITNYHILPSFSINILALVLPWVELLTGLALLTGVYIKGAALLQVAMLGLFFIAISLALARGLDISCGCFGTASASKIGWTHLLEDLAMLAGTIIIYFTYSRDTAPNHRTP